ncbi:MAG: hypothetical protein Q9185_003834 [Variospora sp. 1 TL-2023]
MPDDGQLVSHHVSTSRRRDPLRIVLTIHRSFTWVTVTAVLIESSVSVLRVYYIFGVLITSLRYMADILLLAAVVASIGSYTTNSIANGPGPTSEPRVRNLVSILSIFWLVLLALQLALIIQRVEDGGGNMRDISSAERRVNFIYDFIYTFLAFGICCGTFLLSISPRGRSSQNAQVPNALFLLIGLSLFARHMWITVTDGLYALGAEDDGYERTRSTQVLFARQMFYYVCTVIAYAALVAVGSRLGPPRENMIEENIPRPAAPEPSPKRESFRDRPEDLVYNGADLMVHV